MTFNKLELDTSDHDLLRALIVKSEIGEWYFPFDQRQRILRVFQILNQITSDLKLCEDPEEKEELMLKYKKIGLQGLENIDPLILQRIAEAESQGTDFKIAFKSLNSPFDPRLISL